MVDNTLHYACTCSDVNWSAIHMDCPALYIKTGLSIEKYCFARLNTTINITCSDVNWSILQ